ncbi:head maturation protease, ClpP-related [Pannonibacter tanglangensis]|uniref:ATP-dependent Clp protease proteolytic subunit n=1 Tax=Pannonibacter tanglangensis TaxID=2750084 RepID=A0ABW9ZH16_9HYPH|nr:head maturation protease, ClpP-related [Pannonibacter sp. XCT-34]NBN64152.1 Clp protease ClpP [Pannonibacter sp. XCT-34]
MSLRNLPSVQIEKPRAYVGEPASGALERWTPLAAEGDETPTISIYDVIGQDWWTGEGVTAKRIAGALRQIGPVDVTVNINSPGGDMFEGVTIYNLLAEHPARVTVRVMGLAASAASIIAMAGDTVQMGLGSFLMIHNSWGGVVGNHADFASAAETFRAFDEAMAGIYSARTGRDQVEIRAMMEAETWLAPERAIEMAFADETFTAPDLGPATDPQKAARSRLDQQLAKAGVPRAERRALMRQAFPGTPGAAAETMPGAGLDVGAVQRLIATLKK